MSTQTDAIVEYLPLYIDNTEDHGSGRFEVRDPGRPDDLLATVAAADGSSIERAVVAAERGGREWSAQSLDARIDVLRNAIDALLPLTDALAPMLARENGGLLAEARLDIERGIGVLASSLDYAETYLKPSFEDHENYWLRIEKKPVGVVALIVPWNSPIVLAMSKVGPALVTGNSVLVKPSTEAPIVLTRLLTALAARLPRGAVNVINGGGGLGAILTGHPRIRKISFTGSTEVGREVMRGSAGNLKKLDLELGGNDAAVLLDDIDLSTGIDQLCRGVFTRAGQVCFAVKRIYAPRSRFDEIHEAIRAVVSGYRVGHGLDERSDFGPIINHRQRDRLAELVERTRASGATVEVLGSKVDPDEFDRGAYMLPTIVTGIEHDSELVSIEQFGPVIPIVAYDDVEEAIRMANDSEFGLASSVWGSDIDEALRVANRISAGVTFINSHNLWSLSFDMPFGGVKQSGIGRERTALGLQEYVEDHAIRMIKSR